MRRDLFFKGFGIWVAVAILVGVLAASALAQESEGFLGFPTQTGTITLTDTGMQISPSQLNPGPVEFTVVNNSSMARGVYVTGDDRVGDPLLRYSMRVSPGASSPMNFWLYQGEQYTFRDFTSRRIANDESIFTSTYSMAAAIPVRYPIGAGPNYQWETGRIEISNSGISVSPSSTDLGPIVFTVVNNSSTPRGIILRGRDRSGSDVFRYSRVIAPGASTGVNFWLYEGRTYTVQDYRQMGEMRYSSSFSTTISVKPSSPAAGS